MFSYRHAFHAGNHADVLKHLVLVQLLRYFAQKDTPYWYIDTHAGAGAYALDGDWADKTAESGTGIARLWTRADLPAAVAEYVEEVEAFNGDEFLRSYPGSPFLAAQAMRERDRLRLFELHPTEIDVLRRNVGQLGRDVGRHTMVYAADGFEGVKALLPPPTRRGIVLIDPSYEDKRDYARVVQCLEEGLKRFATGCYAIWYPLVQRREAQQLPARLARVPARAWLDVTLTVRKPTGDGLGLHGSGMFVVNPPWLLEPALKEVMPWLTDVLAQDAGARFSLESRQA
ncbi:23S rRNA (adenine(2030)-N(6))-methyltransferase RlmJ [Pigmentiphaga sp. NML080357]|uniref:23S rRNA (adenine(2030)-N(6))-methyltransferase RlmJ n=1 Tax=Pigmentiphaga sp. NML080357 TaxID=2008675 RepID=UPI000B41D8D6|nr:23S rRNA (adenine(2030)-N(6))-methyltransferase RlmJ [Pigmentiphaga sp. NML080357]OVZ59143.1 23S rRNA (adenine(2030)-N(6))-methyltransferase RlmJ [Pigmentiphaga sp. NML080357]